MHILATLCMFSVIFPSYLIQVKHPYKFFRTVLALRETSSGTSFLAYEVVSGIALPKLDCVVQGQGIIFKLFQWLTFLPCNAGQFS